MTPAKQGVLHIAPEFDGASVLWTADFHAKADGAWIVYFYDGLCTGESVQFHGHIRAVRSMPPTGRHKEI
jgi:hypothetical protein